MPGGGGSPELQAVSTAMADYSPDNTRNATPFAPRNETTMPHAYRQNGHQKTPDNTRNATSMRGIRCAAFILIELLVVIGIIAILAAMLLPALNGARNSARDITSQSHIRDLHKAMIMYRDDNENQWPPKYLNGAQMRNDIRSLVPSFVEQQYADPFRQVEVSADPALITPGLNMDDADSPPGGKGFVYLNFKSKTAGGATLLPVSTFNAAYPNMNLESDTEFIFWGVCAPSKTLTSFLQWLAAMPRRAKQRGVGDGGHTA